MGVSNYSMADIASLTKAVQTTTPEHSTSRKGNTELTMQDFLQLMVVQLQNQTMDNTMDTSEMMNQMVQMQMVTAITNMNELSVMNYAGSLVGKVVTIGILDGDTLEEREILVTGTGLSNGQQVIFGNDGQTYALNQIMAIGKLPPIEGVEVIKPGEDGEEGEGEGAEGVEGEGEGAEGVEGSENGGETTQPPETTRPPEQTQSAGPMYDGTQGAPTGE